MEKGKDKDKIGEKATDKTNAKRALNDWQKFLIAKLAEKLV